MKIEDTYKVQLRWGCRNLYILGTSVEIVNISRCQFWCDVSWDPFRRVLRLCSRGFIWCIWSTNIYILYIYNIYICVCIQYI